MNRKVENQIPYRIIDILLRARMIGKHETDNRGKRQVSQACDSISLEKIMNEKNINILMDIESQGNRCLAATLYNPLINIIK